MRNSQLSGRSTALDLFPNGNRGPGKGVLHDILAVKRRAHHSRAIAMEPWTHFGEEMVRVEFSDLPCLILRRIRTVRPRFLDVSRG